MVKFKIVIPLAVTFMLTGCGFSVLKPVIQTDKSIREVQVIKEKSRVVSSIKFPDENGREDAADKPKQDSDRPAQSPNKIEKEGKLKFEVLDRLDNTKFGWGLSLNKQHKTPGILEYTKKLIDRYNGVYIGDTSKKTVYFTFDEGYENGYTARILDTLKENDVKALFFVTGSYINKNAVLVRRMLNEGHMVGSHTMNHPSLPSINDPALEIELCGFEKQFNSLFGQNFHYIRPPRGEYSERTLAAAQQLGYKTVFWSFAYRDYDVNKQKGADYAYKIVMNNLHSGAVILLHAVSKDNAEALDRIIKDTRKQGYTIRPFDL